MNLCTIVVMYLGLEKDPNFFPFAQGYLFLLEHSYSTHLSPPSVVDRGCAATSARRGVSPVRIAFPSNLTT